MAVKIMIEREFKEIPTTKDIRVINELRRKATEQKRYVIGETLIDTQDNRKMVILSIWSVFDEWRARENSEDRRKFENELIPRLEEPANIRAFFLGSDWLQDILSEAMHDSQIASWKWVMNCKYETTDLLTFLM